MHADRREQQLVLRAQSGDRAAFEALLERVQLGLYRYLCGLLGDAAGAEDVLQEVFVLAYRKLGALREPALLWPWLYRIASREAMRAIRARRGGREQPLDESGARELAAAEAPEFLDPLVASRLTELVRALSPASRGVLLLHYSEGLALDEVADVLGIPLGTAKSRLGYGLAALRARVAGEPRLRAELGT